MFSDPLAMVSSCLDALLALTEVELIGGLVLALLLAVVVAGICGVIRSKRDKATTLMTATILISTVIAMVLAAGYVTYAASHNQEPTGPYNGFVFYGVPAPMYGPIGPPHPGSSPSPLPLAPAELGYPPHPWSATPDVETIAP